jgi:hypothetical protein
MFIMNKEYPPDLGCTLPPPGSGYYCSIEPGHTGPCAARKNKSFVRIALELIKNKLGKVPNIPYPE